MRTSYFSETVMQVKFIGGKINLFGKSEKLMFAPCADDTVAFEDYCESWFETSSAELAEIVGFQVQAYEFEEDKTADEEDHLSFYAGAPECDCPNPILRHYRLTLHLRRNAEEKEVCIKMHNASTDLDYEGQLSALVFGKN